VLWLQCSIRHSQQANKSISRPCEQCCSNYSSSAETIPHTTAVEWTTFVKSKGKR